MIDKKLQQLGFTNFVHLKIALRDDKRRMVWSGSYNDQLISIRIVFSEEKQSWIIEKISCDILNDERLNDLLKRNEIIPVLDFIESTQTT